MTNPDDTGFFTPGEEQFQLIVESMPNALIMVGRSGRIKLVNPQAEQLFGYARGELIEQHIEMLVPESFRNAHPKHRTAYFHQPEARAMGSGRDLFGLRKDGTEVPIEIGLNPLKTPEGTFVLASIIDISERKATENRLRESEERAHQLVQRLGLATEAAQMGIWEYDVVNNVLTWDARMYALYGISESDFSGAYEAWEKGVHPEDLEQARSELQATLQGQGEFHTTFRVRWPDGNIRFIEAHAMTQRDADGRGIRMTGVNWDITDRRRAELARIVSEERFRDLFENATDLIQAVTPEGRFVYVNPAWMKTLGYDRTDIQSLTIADVIHPDSLEHCMRVFQALLTGHPVPRTEAQFRTRKGRSIWVEGQLSCKFEDGRPTTTRGIFRDITVQKKTMAQLATAKLRAESADRLKSAFLATMSHELRTPLNSIIGFTGIVQKEMAGPLNEEQKKQLGMVTKSAAHLLHLINDVLDLSKIEAGQLEVESAPFPLEESLRHCLEMIAPLAARKKLEVRSEISGDLGLLTSDRRRVEQIVINLLTNAIKFSETGLVTLIAEFERNGSSAPAQVAIRVRDTGAGIKPEDLERLFQPFQQLEQGLSRPQEGTGLGLSICKKLLTLLGGEISLESEWGKGSTFSITLPLWAKK